MIAYRLTIVAVLMAAATVTAAEARTTLDQARAASEAANAAARASQQRVAKLDDQTQGLLDKYRDSLRQTSQWDAYAAQVQPLLEQQQKQIASLQAQVAQQGDIAGQILPLMLQMTDSLAKFVKLDLPFLEQERSARIANLKQAMADASIALAGKFKRLAQAYRVEAGYGRSLGAARRDIIVGGQHKTVDVLRIGRVVLLYETPDGDETGYWDPSGKRWVSLGGNYARNIHEGLKIARGDLAATPLPLPVPTATAMTATEDGS